MANILVTDGEQRASLAIVRSLGKAGHRCYVCSSSGRALASRSRYALRERSVPDPTSKPLQFAAEIRSVVELDRIEVVIPVSEASLLAVLGARDAIVAKIPFPDLDTFQAICDKQRVLAEADRLGIRVPRQQEILAAADAQNVEIHEPLVLKPARSVFTRMDGTRDKVGVRWVRSSAELQTALRAYPEAAYPVLAQEAITGPGIGVFVLIHEGQCVACFSHKRIREKPPSGGVSVVSQSEPMDEVLLENSVLLLRSFDWSGVAMVEYKRDILTGQHVLMEINGRFWGSLQLAIDAGVNFPVMLVDTALGQQVIPNEGYGFVRSRWFWGDVDNFIARWRGAETSWRNRLTSIVSLLRACGPGYTEQILRWDDPRPFFQETVEWFREAGLRLLPRNKRQGD